MAGLFPRIKTWIFQEDLSSTDLNAEFDNIINNLGVDKISGDSASVGEMQQTVNPGDVGSESLATNIQGEIERLRYVIQRMLGSLAAEWYSAPPTDLSILKNTIPALSFFQNGVISGAVDANGQPMFLVPDGAAATVRLKCSVTPLSAYINGTQYTFNSDITLAGLTLAPAANNTATIGNDPGGAALSSNTLTKNAFEEDSSDIMVGNPISTLGNELIPTYIPLSTPGSNLTAKDGALIAYKLNAEYGIGYLRGTATRMESALRGYFFDSSSVALPRAGFATADVLTLMSSAFIFLLSGGTLDVTYNQPKIGGNTPSTPANGDYWYDTTVNQWKKYNGTSFIANLSVYVGIAVVNTSACVAARSVDFTGLYADDLNASCAIDTVDTTRVLAQSGGLISVYGKNLQIVGDKLEFISARDAEEVSSLNDKLFYYLSPSGKQLISNQAPHKRPELNGYYHPSKPYRCIAAGANGGLAIRNTKNISRLANRKWPKVLNSTLTATSKTTLGTLNFMARGGRIRVKLNPVSVPMSIQNSGANATSILLILDVTDAYGNLYASFNMARFTTVNGTIMYLPEAAVGAEIGYLTGLTQIVLSGQIITGAGTGTFTYDAFYEIEEIF